MAAIATGIGGCTNRPEQVQRAVLRAVDARRVRPAHLAEKLGSLFPHGVLPVVIGEPLGKGSSGCIAETRLCAPRSAPLSLHAVSRPRQRATAKHVQQQLHGLAPTAGVETRDQQLLAVDGLDQVAPASAIKFDHHADLLGQHLPAVTVLSVLVNAAHGAVRGDIDVN